MKTTTSAKSDVKKKNKRKIDAIIVAVSRKTLKKIDLNLQPFKDKIDLSNGKATRWQQDIQKN